MPTYRVTLKIKSETSCNKEDLANLIVGRVIIGQTLFVDMIEDVSEVDTRSFGERSTPEYLSQALNEGDGVYRP